MRKLEDGTYMFDTNSPWTAVFAHALYSFIFIALAVSSGFFAVNEYVDEGWSAFYYLTDQGTRNVGLAVFWALLSRPFIREVFLKLRQAKSGGAAND